MLHGQFKKPTDKMRDGKLWDYLRNGYLKKET